MAHFRQESSLLRPAFEMAMDMAAGINYSGAAPVLDYMNMPMFVLSSAYLPPGAERTFPLPTTDPIIRAADLVNTEGFSVGFSPFFRDELFRRPTMLERLLLRHAFTGGYAFERSHFYAGVTTQDAEFFRTAGTGIAHPGEKAIKFLHTRFGMRSESMSVVTLLMRALLKHVFKMPTDKIVAQQTYGGSFTVPDHASLTHFLAGNHAETYPFTIDEMDILALCTYGCVPPGVGFMVSSHGEEWPTLTNVKYRNRLAGGFVVCPEVAERPRQRNSEGLDEYPFFDEVNFRSLLVAMGKTTSHRWRSAQ